MDLSSVWRLGWPWLGEWQLILAVAVVTLLLYEQLSYMRKGNKIPGPGMVVPFLGDAIRMVKDPTQFWIDQAHISGKTGMCWNVLFGRFILFVRDSELSQRIFTNVKPDGFQLVGHPFGKKLFGDTNLIFMFGEEHRELRRKLAPNFTVKALGTYVSIQDRIMREHIGNWIEACKMTGKPQKMRLLIRDMNMATSQATFVGPYMTPEAAKRFAADYALFNAGVLAFPFDFPGCAYQNARLAVTRLVDTLENCVHQSKKRMTNGMEPECFADFWMDETIKDIAEAEATGAPAPAHSSDHDVGHHLFDFLFASQDASTSSLTWAVTLLEAHPKVLEKVREEQKRIRPDLLEPITPEQVREMTYTTMVVKEVLRYRPPATLVPHLACQDFPLTEDYVIPKGTIVFPSVLDSSFQGFTDPDTWDPERFSPDRQEDVVFKRNWLPFGAGPHQCPGQRYAVNQLTVFIALLSTLVDWTRERTPDCDVLAYTPTISPKDDGLVRMTARVS
jgi:cytochrome P450 family 710 subfamily A protein